MGDRNLQQRIAKDMFAVTSLRSLSTKEAGNFIFLTAKCPATTHIMKMLIIVAVIR